VLEAAERLFRERGADDVSMDDVARAAGVGKGTLYRRFGDRSGLAFALLNARESEFQEDCIRGAPPLGPGAPPEDRLIAFGRRLLEYVEDRGDLVLAAQSGTPGRRGASPVYSFYTTHVALLLRELDPELDAEYTAHALLSTLSAQSILMLRREHEMPRERIAAGYDALVRALARG
jgi:AcrR family transcriptional regulator